MNTSDLVSALSDVIARVRRGESVLLVEDGEPIAQVGPAPKTVAEDDERRPGTYAPELPKTPIPGFSLSSEPVRLERRPIVPNLSWSPDRQDDDE